MPFRNSRLALWALALAAAALSGCAALNTVDSDVSTFATWPAQRSAGSFVFERLPSQQARPQEQDLLEAAARPALEKAGFRLATDPATADARVQVGVRVTRIDQRLYDDPFWWRGGLYYSRWNRGPFWGPQMSFQFDTPRYEREVVVLVRDRASGQTLYEARAANDGNSAGSRELLAAMFEAAMKDFPNAGINPRRVRVQLAPLVPPGAAAPASAPAPAPSAQPAQPAK
jgi:hypothetical protein